MHICFITNEYPKEGFPHGGVGTFVKVFAKYLNKIGHNVSVVGINNYTRKTEIEEDEEVNLFRLKPQKVKGLTWLLNNLAINSKLKEINKENPIDIVETTELGLAFITKMKRVKYVIRLHGGHHFFADSENRTVSRWKAFQEKRSFKRADGFIAVSNYVKSHTEKHLSYHGKPTTIISSPVNVDMFSPMGHTLIENNNITFVGTVCEKKGIRQLILAMKELVKMYPQLKLNVYGRDWFFKNGDSYINMLKSKYEDVIKSCVTFYGAIPYKEIPQVYGKALLCVFPSHMETQGLVALEAMLMGKAIIFTTEGPGPELITHKENGLLCNPTDPNDIKEKIEWALENSSKLEEIGVKARDFAKENFRIEVLTKRNIEFYNSLKTI